MLIGYRMSNMDRHQKLGTKAPDSMLVQQGVSSVCIKLQGYVSQACQQDIREEQAA